MILDFYKNINHYYTMNFKQNVAWIRKSLVKAEKRRAELLALIPTLKRQVVAQVKVVDPIEIELDNLWTLSVKRPEWEIFTNIVEGIDAKECNKLSDLENKLELADDELNGLNGFIEAAAYDAVDAVSYRRRHRR